MMLLILAALAGGVGAAARFVLDGEIRLRWAGALPISTFVINVLGSLILGVTVGLVAGAHGTAITQTAITPTAVAHDPAPLSGAVALAAVGFCGGFTTFSTAVFEVTQLFHARRPWWAVIYLIGSFVAAVSAVVVGVVLS